eukprot:jgi/Psemu1/34586/gm1.34586_g
MNTTTTRRRATTTVTVATTTTTTHRTSPLTVTSCLAAIAIAIAAIAAAAVAPLAEAGLATMGLRRENMPADATDIHLLERFESARRLQARQMQELFVNDHGHDHDHDHDGDNDHSFEDLPKRRRRRGWGVSPAAETLQEPIVADIPVGNTTADDISMDGEDLFEAPEEKAPAESESDPIFDFDSIPEPEPEPIVGDTEPAPETATETETQPIAVEIRTTGPRGGKSDSAPHIQPTEISFMIMMEDFGYSNGAKSIEEISIGTKFGFSGKIVTKAEELGVAHGTCTVTSDIKKELSYCDIYHKIETDNFGGYGSVMVAGTADEVGGRFLVTGTGGSLQSTNQGYAMVQFDPAGNPVIYVLLKLF